MNDQRKVIFEQRIERMDAEDVSETVIDMRHDVVDNIVAKSIPPRSYPEQWNAEQLTAAAKTYLNIAVPVAEWAAEEGIEPEIVTERLICAAAPQAPAKAARSIAKLSPVGAPTQPVIS